MRNSLCFLIVSTFIITSSCDDYDNTKNSTDTITLSMKSTSGLFKDSIKTQMYDDIKSKHARKKTDNISTYAIFKLKISKNKKYDIIQKATKLGMQGDKLWDGDGKEIDPNESSDASDRQWLVMRDSDDQLMINSDSGYGIWFKQKKYYKSDRKRTTEIPEDSWYIEKAQKYINEYKDIFPVYNEIYPYKIMKSKQGHVHNLVQSEEYVNQIDVAFGQLIDGVPIIGNGGNYVISMDTEGNLVGYQAHPINIERKNKDIKGKDTIDPMLAEGTARTRVHQDKPEHEIIRSDFGYHVRGRSTSQSYLVPTYLYYFLRKSGEQKGPATAESVCATKDTEAEYLMQLDDTNDYLRMKKQKGDMNESIKSDLTDKTTAVKNRTDSHPTLKPSFSP